MTDTDLFFRLDPTAPWSASPLGWPAFVLVAITLGMLTVWTYKGHPRANRRRIGLVLALRIVALIVALLTALRPSVGFQENPKIPSVLLFGIDLSESMTVPDELNNQPRINAVRKTLEKCEPILEELRTNQNVTVVMYGFGDSAFNDRAYLYDPTAPAKFQQSDYAVYLRKTFERWQSEQYVRGHILIGDGTDNGPSKPEPEATRWRQAGRQLHTFAVGLPTTDSGTKDVALTSVNVTTGNPDGSVFIKTDFTLKVLINAFGFVGATVPLKVQIDDGSGYKDVTTETATLTKDTDNEAELKLKAPDRPGEIKVRIEVPLSAVPGDVAPSNNVIETYLTVTKEGMRVLLINRLTVEQAAIRRALAADPRISLFSVIRQTDEPTRPEEREGLDFESNAYDVIILGNVTSKQLTSIDPALPRKIADQVLNKGVGLLMTGGHATFLGTPGFPDATGWRGTKDITDILPIDLDKSPPVPDTVFSSDRARYQFLPTEQQKGHYLNRIGDTPKESLDFWAKLNDVGSRTRFTGLNKMGTAKGAATVFAVASDSTNNEPLPAKFQDESRLAPLLVGHQIGAGSRGRVLVFAAQDTYIWKSLGQPKTNDGIQLHARFWRQMVRWCAHQEEDDGKVFAKPELPRLPVGGRETIRIGVRQPGGAAALEPKFVVKVLAPGENEATAPTRQYFPDADGNFKVPYEPAVPGEHTVKVVGSGKDSKGGEVTGEVSARFFAYPTASDELLVKAAKPDVLQRIAAAGGGQFYRLEDLPRFLTELKSQPLDVAKPKPRYYPDWRRDSSRGFLPGWLVVFVVLLGTEWGLRRYWGMV